MAQPSRNGITEAYKSTEIESSSQLRRRLEANNQPISPLIRAILDEDETKVTELLKQNQEGVNEQLGLTRNYTPLILACGYQLSSAVMDLVQAGADPKQMISWGNLTPLIVAIQSGGLELVRYLTEETGGCVSKKQPNGSSLDEFPPVHVACFFGKLEIVQYLVQECDVKVNMTDAYGVTPLILSLMQQQWEIADYLLRAFGDNDPNYVQRLNLNHKSVHGDTALTICIRELKSEHKAIALNLSRRMLDCGADPLIPTVVPHRQPESSLSLAIQYAEWDFVKYLVGKCGPLEMLGGSAMLAAALALKLALSRDKKFSQLLLKKLQISPSYVFSQSGETCMHELGRIVARHDWTDSEYEEDMIRLLINCGGDVRLANASGETFLSIIEKRHDVRSFVTTLTSNGASRENPQRRMDASTRPQTKKKRGNNKQPSDATNNTSSQNTKRSGGGSNKSSSSRKKSSKASSSHPRPSSSGSSKRRKPKKKKSQSANKENKDDESESHVSAPQSTATVGSFDLLNVGIMDVALSELSLTSGPDQSESETTGGSSAMDDSDGFRKVETRSARNKKSKKQQQQQQRQLQMNRAKQNQGKKSRRNETSVPSSPHVRKQKAMNGSSTSKPSKDRHLPAPLARRLNGKGPQQVVVRRTAIKTDKANEKPKPVRAHASSWNMGKPSLPPKHVMDGLLEEMIEPREVSTRDDEIPEPLIPVRLLSPRDNGQSPGTRTPSRGRSPSVGTNDGNRSGKAEAQSSPMIMPVRMSLGVEEEKSPSEKAGLHFGKTIPKSIINAPTRPPMTARPVKPPKFAGSSAVSLDPPSSSFQRSSPSHRLVMSPTKTHQITFLPDVQQQNGACDLDGSGGLQTDHSSKSGHSTDALASGDSSPASSQQQSVSIAIQTDGSSPFVKPSTDVESPTNDRAVLVPSTTITVAQLDQQPQQQLPQQQQPSRKSATVFSPHSKEFTPMSAQVNPMNNAYVFPTMTHFDPTQQTLTNPGFIQPTPLTVPGLGLQPPFGFVQPHMFPNANFGAVASHQPSFARVFPTPQLTTPTAPLHHVQPMPPMPQRPMAGGHQNQVPMMPYQFGMMPGVVPPNQAQMMPTHQQLPPQPAHPQHFQAMPMGHQQLHPMNAQPNFMHQFPHQMPQTHQQQLRYPPQQRH